SFPYWIYATQQDAGAIATRSRGDLGAVTPMDWKPVPGWEWGTILPDPRDPNVVFSSGIGISKITYPGEEWIKVGPDQDPSLKLRGGNNAPIAFATWNGRRELLAGYQYLMATADGRARWTHTIVATTPRPSTARAIMGRRGRRSSRDCRRRCPAARSRTSCERIPSGAGCCSPARRARCTSHSMTATTGSR